jgi:hypothetical protein
VVDLIDTEPHRALSLGKPYAVFAAAILLICVVAYGLALNGPLFFDDFPNLIENRLLQLDGHSFDGWRVAVTNSDAGLLHRPVAMFTFAVNYWVSGAFSPVVLKGTNLAIHCLIGVLIYFLCQALLRAPALSGTGRQNHRLVALIAASIWLLHPLHVSTVLYAIQRMAQLSGLFVVAGLLVFCRYRLRWAQSGATTGDLLSAGLWLMLLSIFAVLSKENGALLPWLLVVVEVTLFAGVWRGAQCMPLVRLGWLVLLLPLAFVAAVFLWSPEIIAGRFAGREFTLYERLLTEGRVLWHYLGWILLPNITQMGFFHDDIRVHHNQTAIRIIHKPLVASLFYEAWNS